MSLWKTTRISTVAATAFFLFGCSADESKMTTEQHAAYAQSELRGKEIDQSEWDKQMAANKAVLDAIPEYDPSGEEDEIEPPEGRYELLEPSKPAKKKQKLIYKAFSAVLHEVYGKGPMRVGRGGYMPTPSDEHIDGKPADTVVLAIYKYVYSDKESVMWCASDAYHTEEDLKVFQNFQARASDKEFNAYIGKVINKYGGHDVVLNTCR